MCNIQAQAAYFLLIYDRSFSAHDVSQDGAYVVGESILDSQRILATQSDRMTEVSGQVGTNLVATYKALGGGWQIREGEEIVSSENRNEMIKRTSWGGLLDPKEIDRPVNDKDCRDWYWPDW